MIETRARARHAAARKTRWIVLLIALVLASLALGCAGFRAAKLYRAGTDDLNAGRHEAALVQLSEAARLLPTASEIQNHLGLALAANERHVEALRAFERAVALDCDNEAAARNLATATRRAAAQTEPGSAPPRD